MEGRIAEYIVEPDIWLIGTNIFAFNIGIRIEKMRHFISLYIQFTAICIGFDRQKVKKAAFAAG